MKKIAAKGILILMVVALMMAIGCGKTESPQEKYQNETNAQIEEMQNQIAHLKDAYNSKVAVMREEFDAQLAQVNNGYNEAVADLKQKQAAVKEGLTEMKSATGEAWEKGKVKMDKMVEDMSKALQKITSDLKD